MVWFLTFWFILDLALLFVGVVALVISGRRSEKDRKTMFVEAKRVIYGEILDERQRYAAAVKAVDLEEDMAAERDRRARSGV